MPRHPLEFTAIYSAGISSVQEYKNGELIRNASGRNGVKLLRGIRFARSSIITSRSSGESPYYDEGGDWEFGDLEDWYLFDEEDDIYTDGDGHYMWDSDGDGIPDTPIIEPSYCYGNDDWDWYDDWFINLGWDDSGALTPEDDPDDPINGDGGGDGEGGYIVEEDFTEALAVLDKMANDIQNNNVEIKKLENAVLVTSNVAGGLHSSLLNWAETTIAAGAADAKLLTCMSRSVGGITTALGAYQTIIAFTDDNEGLTAGELLNLIATGLGATSLGLSFIGLPMAGAIVGVGAGIVGVISVFFTETIESGEYVITTNEGRVIRIMVFPAIINNSMC